MSSQTPTQSSGTTPSGTGANPAFFVPNPPTQRAGAREKFATEHWGSRPMFQYSYGLTMMPGDCEEGGVILDALMHMDQQTNKK